MKSNRVIFERLDPDWEIIGELAHFTKDVPFLSVLPDELLATPCWLQVGDRLDVARFRFDKTERVKPTRPTHPGVLATWVQLEGSTHLRGGTSYDRAFRSSVIAMPGDVFGVIGTGKLSLENTVPEIASSGLLIEVLPKGTQG